MYFSSFTGLVQGIITGIRGLCNGLGPAVYGFIFYLFHVDLSEDITDNNIQPNIHGFIHAANGTLIVPEEPRVRFYFAFFNSFCFFFCNFFLL